MSRPPSYGYERVARLADRISPGLGIADSEATDEVNPPSSEWLQFGFAFSRKSRGISIVFIGFFQEENHLKVVLNY